MVAFALMHSPSVGPATWQPVAAVLRHRGHDVVVPDVRCVAAGPPPYWQRIVDAMRPALESSPEGEHLVIAGHSNAGTFLPLVAAASPRKASLLFVDASVPPESGSASMVPEELLQELRDRANAGLLPRWTDWWDEADVAPLFPDAATRRTVSDEQVQLPLAYYEERVPVPTGWRERERCGYLLFGEPYTMLADEARAAGWPVAHVPGEHLHMVVDPEAVAGAMCDLAARLAP